MAFKLLNQKNWQKVNLEDPVSRKKLFGALQYFCNAHLMSHVSDDSENLQRIIAQAQHFSADQFPAAVLEIIKTFKQTPETDSNWEVFFDIRDYSGSNKNGFELMDVADGLTFSEVPIGDKAKLYSFAGEKTSVSFIRYGGGLGWDRTLFDDKEYWTLDDIAQAFVYRWRKHRNDQAFSLINAVLSGGAASGSVTGISWQAPIPSGLAATDANYVAIRDMETLSKAAKTLIDANKNKGYGVTERTQCVLLFPVNLRSRVLRALGVLNVGISGSYESVKFNIRPVMSTDLNTSTEMVMGIPGQKNIWADRMPLTVFDKFDPASYSDVAYGWGRFAGAIGDYDQLVRIATS